MRKIRENIISGRCSNWRWNLIIVSTVCTCLVVNGGEASLVRKPRPFYTVEFKDVIENEVDVNDINTETATGTTATAKPWLSKTDGTGANPVLKNEDRLRARAAAYGKAILKQGRERIWKGHPEKKIVNSLQDWAGRNTSSNSEKRLVCYYTVPTFEDRPFAVFPEQIGPGLCTHIILAFARVVNSTIQPNDLKDLEFYNRTLQLKSANKELKILLTIGNGEFEKGFPEMVAQNATRALFIQDCLNLLKTYPFDGFDFDWEFPAYFGEMVEREQFVAFLEDFRNHSQQLNLSLILSAAVAAPKAIVDISYDIPRMARVLDFISIMGYDFHFYMWYSPLTGPNAPLAQSDFDVGITRTLNTAWAAKYWYQNGMPADKIVVGVPTYGHSFKLVDKSEHGYNALAVGPGTTGQDGYATYPEICEFLALNETVTVFDNQTQVPYAYNIKTLDWISYDNEHSAQQKAKFVIDFDFGGVMIWCINNDDAWKMCNTSQTTFPIITTYKKELFKRTST